MSQRAGETENRFSTVERDADIMLQPCDEDETERMVKLRELLAPELHGDAEDAANLPDDVRDDLMLLRFLRGHTDPEKAASMYRKMLRWRATNDIGALRAAVQGKPLAWSSLPGGAAVGGAMRMELHGGFSREGHLVQMEVSGQIRVPMLVNEIGVERFMRTWFAMLERRHELLAEESLARGHVVKVVQIRDVSGLGAHMLNHDTRLVLKSLVAAAQDNFPESMAKIVFVNTPTFFQIIMTLIRPLLHKRTLDKFLVLGSEWRQELFQLIDTSALKSFVRMQQGNAAEAKATASSRAASGDSIPGAKDAKGHGGDDMRHKDGRFDENVDAAESKSAEVKAGSDDDDDHDGAVFEDSETMLDAGVASEATEAAETSDAGALGLLPGEDIEVHVSARHCAALDVAMDEGDVCCFSFSLHAHDIDFECMVYEEAGVSTVVEQQRINAADSPTEQRRFVATGTSGCVLTLKWSNAHSWFKSKIVRYSVTVSHT